MSELLRILHLEDEPDYSGLVREILAGEGLCIELMLVGTRKDFIAACRPDAFDLILADFSLPDFTGVQALEIARAVAPETPFILLSGTIGEAAAVESLRNGATDYVLKQWPDRLGPAVRRAVDEARERARRLSAEAELQQSELQYRQFFLSAPDPMWIIDARSLRFLEVNDAALAAYGFAREEFLSMKATDIRPEEEVQRFREDCARAAAMHPVAGGGAGLWLHRRKSGAVFPVEVNWASIRFGQREAFVVQARDVTQRERAKRRDAALARLGRELNSARTRQEAAGIIRDATDELFTWDCFSLFLCDLDTRQCSQVLLIDTIGGQRVELPEDPELRALSPCSERVLKSGAELILHDDPAGDPTAGVMFGDKSRASASLMFAPIRRGEHAIGVLSVQSYQLKAFDTEQLDLLQLLADHCAGALERIHAEEVSNELRSRFRELFDQSPDAIFVESLDGVVLDANDAACRLNGLPRRELIGKHVTELVPPEKRAEVAKHFAAMARGECATVESESWCSDGRVIPVEIRTGRIVCGGSPALLLHVRDVSERKNAETALRSSEMLFFSVWENSVDGMRLTDENGVVMAVNDAFCKLVRCEREQIVGRKLTDAYANPGQLAGEMARYLEEFRNRTLPDQMECLVTLKDGNEVIFEQSHSFVELQGQPRLLLSLFRDVTEQRRLQDQLRQSQKMEAIGQLAGGVAHDFNNILTVIHGHASMLGMGGKLNELSARSAQQIVQAAERAAGLTRQLLAFSRRQMMQTRQLDFNEVVANITKMLSRILGEDIALRVNYCPHAPVVQADQSMLEQVILNLAVNARDAMPHGGELMLGISIETVDRRRSPRALDSSVEKFVCLSVTDTGCGIPKSDLARIFEPFFTTKAKGKGTGLGLATVYGVVKQHSGWVEVESEEQHGTTFRVFLPHVNTVALPSGAEHVESPARGGTETILLVEDESAVREMVRSLLVAHGYDVLEAESGAHALEVWERCGEHVDLLLTDLVMPGGVNGRELADILLGRRPGLKVIYMSGYSADILGSEFVVRPGVNFLQKPYHPNRLASAVRESLDMAMN